MNLYRKVITAGQDTATSGSSLWGRANRPRQGWPWIALAVILLWMGYAAPGAAAPTAQEQAAIDQVNLRRGQIGLPALNYNQFIEDAARSHAGYLATNDATGHFQSSTLPGFTGVTAAERIAATAYGAPFSAAEVISFGVSAAIEAIEGLIQAIYHRFGIFSTRMNEIGTGVVTNHPTYGNVFVVNSAAQSAVAAPANWVGVYPYDGQTGVTRDFYSDTEAPDAVAGFDRVGYPISLQIDNTSLLSVTTFTVTPVAGGSPLSVQLLTNVTDPNTPASAAAIIPLAPLDYGTEYEVFFAGTVDSVPLNKTWRFTTAALQPITFTPAQPYLAYNTSIDIEISGGSGVYSGALTSYFPPSPADVIFTGPHTLRVTSPASSELPQTGDITITVTDTEGNTGQVTVTVQPTLDQTPDAFSFTPVTGAALSAIVESASIAVSDVNAPTAISIVGGEYAINGSSTFTAQAGTVMNGDTVRVRLTSSALDTTLATATLTIGGVSAAFNVTTGGLDTTPPSVPTGLTATAVSTSQIDLAWDPATDNVGVTAYQVYRGEQYLLTINSPTPSYSDTGLSPSTSYTYSVTACDAAGYCSAQSTPASATTSGSTYAANLVVGFNLIGNSLNITIDVAATFGNQDAVVLGVTDKIFTIWKWNSAANRWAFYSPRKSVADNASFVVGKYDLLTTINPGEGYWVNAEVAMTLPAQTGADFNWNPATFSALPIGFQLIAHAQTTTPRAFNVTMNFAPPETDVVPTGNFFTLWAWNAVVGKWYFYAPQKESDGGLAEVRTYALSRNFLHFEDDSKTLGHGVGFWVNRP